MATLTLNGELYLILPVAASEVTSKMAAASLTLTQYTFQFVLMVYVSWDNFQYIEYKFLIKLEIIYTCIIM